MSPSLLLWAGWGVRSCRGCRCVRRVAVPCCWELSPESTPGPQEAAASPSLGPLGTRRKENQTLAFSDQVPCMCVFWEPASSRRMLHCFRRQTPSPRVLKGPGGPFRGLAFRLRACPKEGQQTLERQHGKLFRDRDLVILLTSSCRISLPGKEGILSQQPRGVCMCSVGGTVPEPGTEFLT